MHSIADALTSLHEHFGFADFREGQREVITAVLEAKTLWWLCRQAVASLFATNSLP